MANNSLTKQRQDSEQLLTVVSKRIKNMVSAGDISFPPNYSPENALKSFWLRLQRIKDKDKNFALDVCTRDSMMNAMLYSVIMGLTVAKDQVYLIVYGNRLEAQISYFGWLAIAKRILKTEDISAQIIYEDDDPPEIEIIDGVQVVTSHKTNYKNIAPEKISGCYVTIIYPPDSNGKRKKRSEIMTLSEIHQAWKQSSNNPFDDKGNLYPKSTHAKFPQEMAKKTVITRAVKLDVKTSDDSDIYHRAIQESLDAEYNFEDKPENVEDKIAKEPFIEGEAEEPEPEKEQPKPKPRRQTKKKNVTKPEPEVEPDSDYLAVSDRQIAIIKNLIATLQDNGCPDNVIEIDLEDRYDIKEIPLLSQEQGDQYIATLKGYARRLAKGENFWERLEG